MMVWLPILVLWFYFDLQTLLNSLHTQWTCFFQLLSVQPLEADQESIWIHGLHMESHHCPLPRGGLPGRAVQEHVCTLFTYTLGRKDMSHEWEKHLCALRFQWQVLPSEEPQREFEFTLPLSLIKWGMRVISLTYGHVWDVQTLAVLCTNNFSKNIRAQFSVHTEALIL